MQVHTGHIYYEPEHATTDQADQADQADQVLELVRKDERH